MNDRCRAGYNRLAKHYEWLEKLRFGNTLQHARVSCIPELANAHSAPHVLVLGDGDGRLLEAFIKHCPTAQITSVDISPVMIEQQRKRFAALSRSGLASKHSEHAVTWITSPIESFPLPTSTFDTVITAFFLDCFDERQLNELLPRIANALNRQARWYVVDFCEPKRGLRRWWAKFWLAIMHAFFRWQTGLGPRRIVDPSPPLHSLGFEPQLEKRFHFEMIRATVYQRQTESPNP
ncbi:ubiquinone/menaquinone biosynthesis methyltransferase [Novipirellula galeiformis]|uniref:Ubiquinone/menaquinone biosynthesis methyltransferase n=1 Tax=Novipirellula galeiformis TaxID=2528004 RepID=A0A5C6CVD2_9BACT|nr:class I SAM-dependent methyltransferase [Novipirellula galeiformis]TWU26926.1 ubiquinone/menaquinone biosynthesis methyltransferase [Novipirellula galeiformis]